MKDATRHIWEMGVAAGHDMKGHFTRLSEMMPEDDVRMFAAPSAWVACMPETEPALRAAIRRAFPKGIAEVFLNGRSFLDEVGIAVADWQDVSQLKCLKCARAFRPKLHAEAGSPLDAQMPDVPNCASRADSYQPLGPELVAEGLSAFRWWKCPQGCN
jgi:hypothetical protein